MSIEWAERERRTNRFVRKIADYIFNQGDPTPSQIYGLAGLSWITKSNKTEDGISPKHNNNVVEKLGDTLEEKFSSEASIKDVIPLISQKISDKSILYMNLDKGIGFTNFYSVFKNSVIDWVEQNYSVLLPMCNDARQARTNDDRLALVEKIAELDRIPSPNGKTSMRRENYLTPLFFMLDPKIKFPIINGRANVEKLLRKGGVIDKSLVKKARYMMELYGQQGIKDAADVDCLGESLPNFLGKNKYLISKPQSGRVMPIKDEDDVEIIHKAGERQQQQKHNKLTNSLIESLSSHRLLEGKSPWCKYDVLVENYRGSINLLIEVKSSTEVPDVRLAVGQLFYYLFNLEQEDEDKSQKYDLAILLPERPSDSIVEFLKWRNINLLWFEAKELCTANKKLEKIATVRGQNQ